MADELRSSPNVFDLITGQFPHHGEAYYGLRIERLSKLAVGCFSPVRSVLAGAY